MKEEILVPKKIMKTYSNRRNKAGEENSNFNKKSAEPNVEDAKKTPISLTTKKAVEYLLDGTLKWKVCRYCLNESSSLSELDQILQVAGKGALYKVTIKEMISAFHPHKVVDDPNFPNKICNRCINRTISSYLFSQQCEQAERALRNCFDDMYEKLIKLDPLVRPKRRGKQKSNPNHNVLHTEHRQVMDYAEPIITLINAGSESITNEPEINALECLKCAQILPNLESLLNHEKSHPSTMWYNCRLCGTSFVKHNHLKKHLKNFHTSDTLSVSCDTNFKCKECGAVCEKYNEYFQHIEKHKFKIVLESIINKDMNKLCTICMNKEAKMFNLENLICLHGGYPELTGDRSLYNILGSILPDMNILHNNIGTKICERCLDHAITSYIFINQSHCVRNRLNYCIDLVLENVNKIEPQTNIFIEISKELVLNIIQEYDEQLLLDENDYIDESKLKVDVLEDEFRIETVSDSSNSDASDVEEDKKLDVKEENYITDEFSEMENPSRHATKTYSNRKFVNGFKATTLDVCSEFLTFKKRKVPCKRMKYRYICPLCGKHFITEYYLKRHIQKHVNRKIECNLCYRQFKSKFYLYEHKKSFHLKKQESIPCDVCGRTFSDQLKFKTHIKSHIKKQCLLCDKIFITQKHFNSHMQRHAEKFNTLKNSNAQTCSFCEKTCLSDNDLSTHVNKVHLQIKPYNCDMCDRSYYTEYDLLCHKRIHSQLSKETCNVCNKILKSRKDLVIHVRKHLNVRPYNCQVCDEAFYSELGIKSHMNKCHGGRFCCGLCKYVFKKKSDLKLHVLTAHRYSK